MIEKLNLLSTKMNVSGAEKELSEYVSTLLKENGLDPEPDSLGNIIVRNKNFSQNKLMICCPLDNPGFLCLYREKRTNYLVPTSKILTSDKTIHALSDKNKNSFNCKASKEFPNYWTIEKDDSLLGEPFRLNTSILQKENKIEGRFVTRYILIDLLIKLSRLTLDYNIVLCFTVGFHAPTKSENCLAKRIKPEALILLDSLEEKNCALLVKDGKSTANPELVKWIFNLANKIHFKKVVSPRAVTKAETVAIPGGVKVLSLALPCENKGKKNESVKTSKVSDFEELLLRIIQSI